MQKDLSGLDNNILSRGQKKAVDGSYDTVEDSYTFSASQRGRWDSEDSET